MKFSFFTGEKNLCILHGQVFVMRVDLIEPVAIVIKPLSHWHVNPLLLGNIVIKSLSHWHANPLLLKFANQAVMLNSIVRIWCEFLGVRN